MRPELSIVIPFLNEEYVLPLLCGRLESVENRPLNWELLFVSDGSTDGSSRFIEAWASKDPSVKLIVLTRNFGHQNAVSAGLSFALGNYVGIMDADLQDEPEILLEMYRTLRKEKVDIVYAVRAARRESRLKRFFYSVFYRLYVCLADTPVQADSGDFCVMTHRAVRLLLSLPEKLRFVRGLEIQGIQPWGLLMIPLLLARKTLLRRAKQADVIRTGFVPPNSLSQLLLHGMKNIETSLPFRMPFGTSILAWGRLRIPFAS